MKNIQSIVQEEIRHFKSMLRQGSLRHMNIILDDKFQKELLNIIKDYEQLQQENQKYKEVIDKLKNKTKENIENAKYEITTLTIGDKAYYQYIEKILDNYVDILKEVE